MRLRLLSGLISVGLISATVLAPGCLGVGDIDRTQPDAVRKSIFKNADGTPKEYFYRQTVIDVPATSGVTFIGEQGDTDRIIFEISEDYLYAYRSYGYLENNGLIPGDQGDNFQRPGTNTFGSPLAAFRISSHFDIQRQYNPSTGEQTNVIVENSSDRPWFEREFMRVDWGSNDIADFRFGSASNLQASIRRDIQSEDDNPLNQRDRPKIGEDYVDVVTEYHVQPEAWDLSMYGWGMVPLCYFYSSIYKDCLGGTIRVRSSFMPVDRMPRYADNNGSSDYVAMDFDDVRFQKFGFFRTERYRYNDNYNLIEGDQIRLANRWNLWRDAASCYDPNADLPYGACTPDQLRTVVYYLNEEFPREITELVATVRDNADEWDRVFKSAVQASAGFSDTQLSDRRLFTICVNNPVQAGDPAECGPVGTNPQAGDLRFSMYYYVPKFQDSAPLGYGPSAADPFTGEIIQGNAFYYGEAAGWLAQRTLDILKHQLGVEGFSAEDIADGLPAREAVALSLQRAEQRDRRGLGPDVGDRARELAEVLDIKNKARRLNQQIARGDAFIDKRNARKQAAKRSPLPSLALTDEVKEVFGAHVLEEGIARDDVDATIAARLLDDEILFARQKTRQEKLLMHPSKTCVLSAEDTFDEGLMGMLRTVRVKFYDTSVNPPVLKPNVTEQDVFFFLLGQTMGDTQLHEIGHTVGLRHNFSGSTDALNFDQEYWELKGDTLDDEGIRPRYEWEIPADGVVRDGHNLSLEFGLRDFQDSSVMDYASTFGTTTRLGSYDLAAIKYAYGDVVEVFNSADITPERARLLRQGETHYSNYPEIVSNAASYAARIESMYDRRNVNFRKVKRLEDAVAGDAIEVPYSFCSDEYRDASATCATWDGGADNFERTEYAISKYRNYRIFNTFKRERLNFGIDVFSYLARVYNRDYTYMLNQYKNWVNDELILRRGEPCLVVRDGNITTESGDRFVSDSCGNAGFIATVATVNLLAEVIQSPDVGCYVRLQPGCYDFNAGNFSDSFPPDEDGIKRISSNPNDPSCDVPLVQPTSAREDRRVLVRVTTSSQFQHVNDSESCSRLNNRNPTAWVPPVVVDAANNQPIDNAFIIRDLKDDGVVRASNTLYDREKYGYYFYIKPTVIGSWWEKWLAVKAMGDANTDFIGVDSSSDTRSFLINLNTIFGDSLNNLIGGAITGNVKGYGAALRPDGSMDPLPLLDLITGNSFDRTTVIDPTIDPDQQYTFRLLALYNAAYNGQYTDNYEFGESIKIGMSQALTDVQVDAAIRADPTRFTSVRDPVTGVYYYSVKQVRSGADDLYSIGFEFIREIKEKYYVGGADGDGETLLPGFQGTFEFQPRQDLEVAQIIAATASTFGYADVWSGDLDF